MTGDGGTAGRNNAGLPQVHLDELLDEIEVRVRAIRSTRDGVHALLEAVLALGTELELEQVLHRIVESAVALVDARYGALGVVGDRQGLVRFVTTGIDQDQIERIGAYPEGKGVLGELIRHAVPLRLADLSAHPAAYGFPPDHPPMTTFLGVPVRVRGEIFGDLYITEKRGGGEFDAEDEQLLSALAAAAGVAVEKARLYDEVMSREQWLRASAEITGHLLSGGDPADALGRFAVVAQEMAEADVVAIAVPVQATGSLVVDVAAGAGARHLRGTELPIAASLPGRVFSSGVAAISDDLHSDAQGCADIDPQRLIGPVLVVPLGGHERPRGVLLVGRATGRLSFTPALVDLMTAFSGQAAITLELAERRREAERLLLLEDRDRIARDLHDLAIQRLFATGMILEGASRLIENPEAASRVARAVDDLDDTIKVIRSTIFALQSRASDTDQPPALRAQVVAAIEAASEGLHFMPSLKLEGLLDTRVSEELGAQVVAVVREGLSNVTRHASASRVELTLTVVDEVIVRIADDGVGMRASQRRSGLQNLKERAERLGGSLRVLPGIGSGTALEWQVPLPDEGSPGTDSAAR